MHAYIVQRYKKIYDFVIISFMGVVMGVISSILGVYSLWVQSLIIGGFSFVSKGCWSL